MKSYKNGKFAGRYDSSTEVNLFKILKWKLFSKKESLEKDIVSLEVVHTPEKLHQKEDFICWLSHASYLIQLGGKRILLDPVLGDIPFYKRKIPPPYSVEELGACDYLLLSHVHYDHFDRPSLKEIAKKEPKAILPLHMSKVLHKTAASLQTKELDWYESTEEEGLTITLVPAMHWGRRGVFDKNAALWGGFVLQYKGTTVYFAGDTAKGAHFEAIGKRFDIDYALLPIGAYKPEFIMKYNHLNPQEAFEAFEQLGAKKMIPMHYGTYKLTDEPLDEPLAWIKEIGKENPNKINILKVGEVLSI